MTGNGGRTDDVLASIRAHRDDLETLAASDLPASVWAKCLLRYLGDEQKGEKSV